MSACAAWFAVHGYTPTNILSVPVTTLNAEIYEDGVQCVNNNQSFCSATCSDISKRPTACYSCLSDPVSCPAVNCRTKGVNCGKASNAADPCCQTGTGSCCPNASSAIECGACVAARGAAGGAGDFVACYTTTALSSTTTIIIIVSCVVAVILVIITAVTFYKIHKRRRAKQQFLAIATGKVDPATLQQVANLDLDTKSMQQATYNLAVGDGQ
jgi:hypothetical protein